MLSKYICPGCCSNFAGLWAHGVPPCRMTAWCIPRDRGPSNCASATLTLRAETKKYSPNASWFWAWLAPNWGNLEAILGQLWAGLKNLGTHLWHVLVTLEQINYFVWLSYYLAMSAFMKHWARFSAATARLSVALMHGPRLAAWHWKRCGLWFCRFSNYERPHNVLLRRMNTNKIGVH